MSRKAPTPKPEGMVKPPPPPIPIKEYIQVIKPENTFYSGWSAGYKQAIRDTGEDGGKEIEVPEPGNIPPEEKE